ncbi:S24/S26 family peptidase [Halegenticoccus soli]|uniref:S26 family signal peptidase n=1 Tax=Halegenticoccus soli TaxID=1985678 RepID=UPI000C6D9E07|nr:S26 family signal peptidase [Halegenticoccus soli]
MSDDRRSWTRTLARSFLFVAVLTLALFATCGVWPPMVAVESGSMSPNIQTGDLVVVTDTDGWTVAAADGPDIDTVRSPDGDPKFGAPGDVIIYDVPSRGTSVIHRAHFRVERGENWYDRANESYLPPDADGCDDLRNCPAPHGGYITKGDANPYYDQVSGIAPPVRPQWIKSKAGLRVPELGWIRLVVVGRG